MKRSTREMFQFECHYDIFTTQLPYFLDNGRDSQIHPFGYINISQSRSLFYISEREARQAHQVYQGTTPGDKVYYILYKKGNTVGQ